MATSKKKRERRHFSAEDKVMMLKRHLVDHVPVSKVCEEFELHPNIFYRWQQQFFENAAAAFETSSPAPQEREMARKIQKLEEKLARKDEVIAEIGEEFVKLKKELGEL